MLVLVGSTQRSVILVGFKLENTRGPEAAVRGGGGSTARTLKHSTSLAPCRQCSNSVVTSMRYFKWANQH